ncbi:MAG: radical SAM protein, partial [Pseudomonadota bacterium]|nr:radical SAM protein [Pseudomonadota bacterium]
IWPQLLKDVDEGNLQPRYQRSEPLNLAELKPYPTHLIPLERYDGIWSVVVSRGCPYRCSFCTIPDFFKGGIRYRPVEDVVEEIRNSGAEYVELHADNLLVNRKYCEELFQALIPLNIHWIGETSINLAKDEELLDLAVASGLSHVLLGLETPSEEALKGAGKTFFKPEDAKQHIRKFIDRGVEVDAAFLFGFDEHDKNIFQKTYDYVKAAAIQSVHSVILIPFPGTRVYREMSEQKRIKTRDWSQYDGSHVVFEPKGMSADQCQEGAEWFYCKSGEAPVGYSLYRWLDISMMAVALISIGAGIWYYFL